LNLDVGLPVITAPAGAQRELTEAFGNKFSCNCYRSVWPKVRQGFTPKDERNDLAGTQPWLDKLVKVGLSDTSLGGRFYIREGRAYMAASKRPIAQIREGGAEVLGSESSSITTDQQGPATIAIGRPQ